MKYKQIVQELRESQDLNVQIFLNDVDKITKLSQKEKKSLLTKLQNPGVIGAYKCLNKYKKDGAVSDKTVRVTIIGTIKKMVCKKECPFTVCRFNENDPRLYQEINRYWGSYNTKTAAPGAKQDNRFQWTRNEQGIRVKKCCASCAHKDLTRALSKRYCSICGKNVEPIDVCESWEMSDQMKVAGLLQ